MRLCCGEFLSIYPAGDVSSLHKYSSTVFFGKTDYPLIRKLICDVGSSPSVNYGCSFLYKVGCPHTLWVHTSFWFWWFCCFWWKTTFPEKTSPVLSNMVQRVRSPWRLCLAWDLPPSYLTQSSCGWHILFSYSVSIAYCSLNFQPVLFRSISGTHFRYPLNFIHRYRPCTVLQRVRSAPAFLIENGWESILL